MSKVTLRRDELVADATRHMAANTRLTEFGDWPHLMADFAMMIAARVAVRMTPPHRRAPMKVEDVPEEWLEVFRLAYVERPGDDGWRYGLAAVAPLIAAAERERAAKMIEEYGCHNCEMDAELAAAIRARQEDGA